MTELDARCVRTIQAVAAPHNLPPLEPCGDGLAATFGHGTEFATWDGNTLTRLVIAAHANQCRVGIVGARGSRLEVTVHPRTPGDEPGRVYEHHPNLEQLAATIRGTRQRSNL